MKYEFHVGDYVETVGGSIGCFRHHDQEHREIVKWCGSCEDFYCFRAERGE